MIGYSCNGGGGEGGGRGVVASFAIKGLLPQVSSDMKRAMKSRPTKVEKYVLNDTLFFRVVLSCI